MKQSFAILALGLFASMSAFAGPVVSVECKNDRRPVDGPLTRIAATLNSNGNYDFVAEIIPAGRGGGQPFVASLPARECDFSEKVPGVFTCTPEGDIYAGDNYKDDQFATTSYSIDTFMGEIITAKIEYAMITRTGRTLQEKTMQFDASDCKMVMKVKKPTETETHGPTKATPNPPDRGQPPSYSSDPHAFDRE